MITDTTITNEETDKLPNTDGLFWECIQPGVAWIALKEGRAYLIRTDDARWPQLFSAFCGEWPGRAKPFNNMMEAIIHCQGLANDWHGEPNQNEIERMALRRISILAHHLILEGHTFKFNVEGRVMGDRGTHITNVHLDSSGYIQGWKPE
jgi:hypothetical protein